ncbi:MAG: DUF4236 domain-containing protein [Caulobacterales bacterium]|nr:DUF4236 domain-containing protein [Caulobacterales bacterium]MCA0372898.1 DUF4236 domain-containing protein [Pseudomonadota bacterium]
MPFYFRKSVSAGPFRFNFSKSGIGLSVGIKGLRIGTGPRGHYIHAGRGGLYYRASIGRAGMKTSQKIPLEEVSYRIFEDADMREIESSDVMSMKTETHNDLLKELNTNSLKQKMSFMISILSAIIGVFIASTFFQNSIILGFILCFPGYYFGKWLDSYRRTSVLFFEIDENFNTAYLALVSKFEDLSSCGGKWHISEKGDIVSLDAMKRNAGAAVLVKKNVTLLTFSLPSIIKSNINPPRIGVGKQNLYFFPDVILVEEGNKYGAISYNELLFEVGNSRFIEDGIVPHDAKIVDYTWRFVNKNGSPDRRFSNNRQIPICLYESLMLYSNSGLNELLEFSKQGVAVDFAITLRKMADLSTYKQ